MSTQIQKELPKKADRIRIIEAMRKEWPELDGDVHNINTITDKFIYMMEAGVPLKDINIVVNGNIAGFQIAGLKITSENILKDTSRGVRSVVSAGMYKESHEKVERLGLDLETKMEALIALSEAIPVEEMGSVRGNDISSLLSEKIEESNKMSPEMQGYSMHKMS